MNIKVTFLHAGQVCDSGIAASIHALAFSFSSPRLQSSPSRLLNYVLTASTSAGGRRRQPGSSQKPKTNFLPFFISIFFYQLNKNSLSFLILLQQKVSEYEKLNLKTNLSFGFLTFLISRFVTFVKKLENGVKLVIGGGGRKNRVMFVVRDT